MNDLVSMESQTIYNSKMLKTQNDLLVLLEYNYFSLVCINLGVDVSSGWLSFIFCFLLILLLCLNVPWMNINKLTKINRKEKQ